MHDSNVEINSRVCGWVAVSPAFSPQIFWDYIYYCKTPLPPKHRISQPKVAFSWDPGAEWCSVLLLSTECLNVCIDINSKYTEAHFIFKGLQPNFLSLGTASSEWWILANTGVPAPLCQLACAEGTSLQLHVHTCSTKIKITFYWVPGTQPQVLNSPLYKTLVCFLELFQCCGKICQWN